MGRRASEIAPWHAAMAADIYVLAKALNFEPNVHQKRLFNAAMRAKYGQASPFIAVKSGQGTGKTAGSCVLPCGSCSAATPRWECSAPPR